MDLAIGARRAVVMMTLFAKDGSAKLVPSCTLPLTGLRCTSRLYTDLAVIDLGPHRASVVETFGIDPDELDERLGLSLERSR